ncbi:MAG: hypothetical protein IKM59_02425, partial [Oscillospiraceae bacterium]|nr:hypothetical protein [Oscillospiraceae bacterium]
KDLNGDSDTGDTSNDVEKANDVTGILFIAGQNGTKPAKVDQDDKYVGIHLGMSGQIYTRDVADGNYLKQYLLRADGTELKHETYKTSIYFYTKDKKYYCTDSAGKAVALSAIDVNLAFGNEITFYDSKYKTVGPENEIYLTDYNGIALYIGDNIPTGTKIHLSLKTINGRKAIMRSFNNNNGTEAAASWKNLTDIRNTDTAGNQVFTTRTEMYYDFSNMIYRDTDGKCYLFLQHANEGEQAIVSLCNLKIIGNVTIRPAVNLRTIMLANEIFYDTPIDESMEIRHSLNLASDISVNYVVPANLLEGAESSYLTVEVPRYEGNTLIGSETVTIEPVLVGKLYYYTLKGLTAVNMNDELKATLYYVKDGETYRSYEDIYSIATYAYNQLNGKSVPESLKTLCANLLRYGAAAQAYKGYRTDCPADGELREADRIYLTDPEIVPFGTTNEVMKDLEAPSVTWKGKVLNLESKIALKFVIDPTNYEGNAETLSLRITYRKSNGEEETVILSESELYTEGRPYRAFEFNGLLAAELRAVLTVAVYEGETRVSNTLQYAADSYGQGKTGNLGTLCKALFAYVDVAKAFFEG